MVSQTGRTTSVATEDSSQPAITGRIKRIAILFTGIGLYALAGAILRETLLLENSIVTYLVVGLIVGVIGILLMVIVIIGRQDLTSDTPATDGGADSEE